MKKIAIVSNYFGTPPSYFQLWLDSCAANPTIDWQFISDISPTAYRFPPNVHLILSDFHSLQKDISARFPYPIRYEKPWDFCALRPAFGVLFENILTGYDFWGYCDCDLIFGNLRSFFTEDRLSRYDKLMPKGHLSLVRNNPALNQAIFNHPLMREAIDVACGGLPCFDEEAFRKVILPEYGATQFNDIPFMNPKCRAGNFQLEQVFGVHESLDVEASQFLHNVYTWSNGNLIGHYAKRNGDWTATLPVAYCHFFRREMKTKTDGLRNGRSYIIIPNTIKEFDGSPLDARSIRRLNHWRLHTSYFRKRLTPTGILRKLGLAKKP